MISGDVSITVSLVSDALSLMQSPSFTKPQVEIDKRALFIVNLDGQINVICLQKEDNDAFAKAEQTDAAKQECARIVAEKDRKCGSWYPWTEHLTPKEHLEEFKEGLNKLERKRTDGILIGLTWALVFFTIVQTYYLLA